MKLIKRDRKNLFRILDNLERAQSFLMSPDTLVCIERKQATTTLDYINAKGEVCYSIDKEIGSELALLHTAVDQLRKSLAEEID